MGCGSFIDWIVRRGVIHKLDFQNGVISRLTLWGYLQTGMSRGWVRINPDVEGVLFLLLAGLASLGGTQSQMYGAKFGS